MSVITVPKIIAAKKLVTMKPSKNQSTDKTSKPLIINVNKPNVSSCIGNEINFRTGFKKVLTKPIISAKTNAVL